MQMGQTRWLGLSGLAIIADQIVKAVVVAKFELFERMAVLPPVLELTRLHNRGAAFSDGMGKKISRPAPRSRRPAPRRSGLSG